MKTLSMLLSRRPALLQQARLANLAFAYAALQRFAQRIARAQLRGRINVKHAAPDADRYWASLTALDASQSVIDEHFSDEDLMELADVMAFVSDTDALDLTFALDDITDRFIVPLREELEREGITIDRPCADAEVA